MQVTIKHVETGKMVNCQIKSLTKKLLQSKKYSWKINWEQALEKSPKGIFAIVENNNQNIHGIILLIIESGMMIMDLIELAPQNIGAKKEHENVAGCLIAFGCRQSIKTNTAYRGYLTFVSKSELISWYKEKYFATQSIGQRMYIDPISGAKLINKYLIKNI